MKSSLAYKAFKSALTVVVALMVFSGCTQQPQKSTEHSHDHQGHHHHHEAPHGGTLVQLGGEFAHLELVLDKTNGELTLYVLDSEALNGVSVSGEPLEMSLELQEAQNTGLKLMPVADELTGETKESTSRFVGRSDRLRGVANFRGILEDITVKGRKFQKVEFSFPEGNEQ